MIQSWTAAKARKWLALTPLRGRYALMCGIGAVALPTAVRAALEGGVTGCEFTPYVPFVLLSALLLRWWQAAAVAFAAVAIMAGVFDGAFLHPADCFIPASATFAATSVVMIGIASVARLMLTPFPEWAADRSAGRVVFSLDKGHVWANWHGTGSPVRLGTRKQVAHMMKDFLAQEELAERLRRKA